MPRDFPNVNGYIGLRDANTFNYAGTTTMGSNYAWQAKNPMTYRRWYPTVTTLGNGDALVVAGQRYGGPTTGTTTFQAEIPEVFNAASGTWQSLNGASRLIPNYPWMFLAPDGQVFNAGPNPDAKFLNPTAGTWGAATYNTQLGLTREYGSAVMYAPGKILILGGLTPNGITNTAERIDLNAPASATFQPAAPMVFPRTHVNATILPDGSVLATGGSKLKSSEDYAAVFHAELWRPGGKLNPGGTWTLLNEMSVPRLYHSTAVLLPDATVLTAGGGQGANYSAHPDYQIFTPPYLCKGLARPEISSAPQAVSYGQNFSIASPEAADIFQSGRVTLVRLSSVTHAFNMNQRFLELTPVNAKYGQLFLQAPGNPNICPPGHYMMFLLDRNGTPSHASIIKIDRAACSSLSITTNALIGFNPCNQLIEFTVNGGNAASTYTWTVNGVLFGTQPNQTTIQVTTDPSNPTVQVSVKLDNSECGANSTMTSYFPTCEP